MYLVFVARRSAVEENLIKMGLYKAIFLYIKKMDILEKSIQNKDIKFITFLLREDPRLIHHILSDGTSVLQKFINVQLIVF